LLIPHLVQRIITLKLGSYTLYGLPISNEKENKSYPLSQPSSNNFLLFGF
jgi:hypothetical protein